MTENCNSALYTALAYHRAWTSQDLEQAMTYIAPDIFCHAPAGPVIGAEAFRAFMGRFCRILIRSELIAAFGDSTVAVLIYDTDTVPVRNATVAEYLTVRHGHIVAATVIFDRVPFDQLRPGIL